MLDGEIVAVNADGKDSFEVLQQRMNLQNEREIKRVSKPYPGVVRRLRPPLARRTRHDGADVRNVGEPPGADRRRGPPAATDELRGRGWEGLRRDRLFVRARGSGRQAARLQVRVGPADPDWSKIKPISTQDCATSDGPLAKAVGRRARSAARRRDRRGRAPLGRSGGNGLHQKMLEKLLSDLQPLVRKDRADRRPVTGAADGVRRSSNPSLVCEVEYHEITKSTGRCAPPSAACDPTRRPTSACWSRPRSTTCGRSAS